MTKVTGVLLLAAGLCLPAAAGEKRADNPVDAWTIAQAGPAGKAVEGPFRRRPEILDTVHRKHGDFSIIQTIGDPKKEGAVGLWPGQFIDA
jgi:hypothetical protein